VMGSEYSFDDNKNITDQGQGLKQIMFNPH